MWGRGKEAGKEEEAGCTRHGFCYLATPPSISVVLFLFPHFGKSGCCFTSSGKGKMVNRENLRPTFYLGTYRMEKGTGLFCGVPGVETGQWGKYLFSAGLRTVVRFKLFLRNGGWSHSVLPRGCPYLLGNQDLA